MTNPENSRLGSILLPIRTAGRCPIQAVSCLSGMKQLSANSYQLYFRRLDGQSSAAILKMMHFSSRQPTLALLIGCTFAIAGCSRNPHAAAAAPFPQPSLAAESAARVDIASIPAPRKSLYMPVREEADWQNPFLSVESGMLLLRIYLPDENTSSTDIGGMTRPSKARKQQLTIRLSDLPRALAALPEGCWPYGRVVAVAEGFESAQDRAQIRKNMEITYKVLNDLGVVADEWNPNSSVQ